MAGDRRADVTSRRTNSSGRSTCGEWPTSGLLTLIPSFVVASPGLLILPFPGMFRFTCYYYRKAYYRSFVGSPPACAVAPMATGKKTYKGETALLLFQNLHRYTLYFALIFIVLYLMTVPERASAITKPLPGASVT